MNDKYSVDDILTELEGNKQDKKVSSTDYESIVDEILGKKPSNNNEINSKEENKKEIKFDLKDVKEESKSNVIAEENNIIKFDPQKEKIKKEIKNDFEDKTIQMEPFGLMSEDSAELKIEPEDEDLTEFNENRKKIIEKFVLFGEDEDENEPDAEDSIEEDVKTIEDFNDYSESTAIIKDLSVIKAGLILRIIVLFVLSLSAAYIEFAPKLHIPMPEILCRDIQPLSYLIVSAMIFIAAIIVSAPAVFGGFSSLFRFKPDSDSLLAVSVIGTGIQLIALSISPSYIVDAKNTICIYSVITILNMLFNTFGKLTIIKRVRLNFRFVSGGYEKYAIVFPQNENFDNYVKKHFNTTYSGIAVPKKTDFIGSFLGYSYREDTSDKLSKILSPILLISALVLSVCSAIFLKDVQKAACTFAAITAICSPLSAMLAVNLPLLRTTKKIISRGSMISGMSACNEVYDTNAVLIKSADLFPKGSIQLSAIKTFASGKIDDAILDAASVVIKAESDLSEVFLAVIGGRKDLLRDVDTIVYEESMGLSAWVDSKRVLIGNRELIHNHGIAVPSKDYEDRYLNSGMDMVYLAVSGELVAVFLIKYNPGSQIKKSMKILKKLGIGLLVSSTDPNINSKKIARIFDISNDMVKTVPVDMQGDAKRALVQSSREDTGIASISSFSSFVQTIYAAIKIKSIVALSVCLQTIGIIIGFAIMIFFTFVSESVGVSVEAVLLYQLFWFLSTILTPMFRKIKI